MTHGKIVCVCGILIAQCRCISPHRNVTVRSPCTHTQGNVVQVPVPQHPPGNLFERIQERINMFSKDPHYSSQHRLEAPVKPARHIINDGHDDYDTTDGLAFSIGVCVIEAETRKSPLTVFTVKHPNHVSLYTVRYDDNTGNIIVKPTVV